MDLENVFQKIQATPWDALSREEFVKQLCRTFPAIWRVHPFREGNTRTVVMLLTFFVEHHGYYMDQNLMAASSGYVRDSFVMASLDQLSEYEHLEKILMDAVSVTPIIYVDEAEDVAQVTEKYQKYHREDYQPQPHYQV